MQLNGDATQARSEESGAFSTWFLVGLGLLWILPRAMSVVMNFAVDHNKFLDTRIWTLGSSNLYLICSLVVLLAPFMVQRGTLGKSTLRNIFSRVNTPLILLALLPEIAWLAQSIYYHKGLGGAYTGKYFLESIWYSIHSVSGIWHWVTTWGQYILEGLSLVWLKVLLIGVSDRRKSMLLFGGFEFASLILSLASSLRMFLLAKEHGTLQYAQAHFSTGLVFWNILEVLASVWIASMLFEAFRPKLNAVAILFYAPVLGHYFFTSGSGWTFRAATGIPAILIWAILSRSKLNVTSWHEPPAIDEEALQID